MKKLYCVIIGMVFMPGLFSQSEPFTKDYYNIGATYYDVQTIRTMQNRIFTFEDGTIGAVWNMGNIFPAINDMEIGYNYFDGESWVSMPYQSITNQLATNPSYTKWGEIGEICVSQGEDGLIVSTREVKGTGEWVESYGPGSNAKHPFVITNGLNNTIIHLLYLIPNPDFIPTNAQPERGFIYYARSSDGGTTWDINQVLDGLGQEHYLGFTIGSYAWAIPKNENIAFVAGDYLTDLVLMKSDNGGEDWQKTVIWEHPFPMFEIFTVDVDSFYCNDGGIAVALDSENNTHVTFSLSRVFSSTQQNTSWCDPKIGGLVYWKEGMETFSNNINALCPYGHPESELVEDVNLLASIQGQGFETVIPYPTPGMITMPQISIHDIGTICVVYSSVTELSNPGEIELRHLWGRLGDLNGNWSENT